MRSRSSLAALLALLASLAPARAHARALCPEGRFLVPANRSPVIPGTSAGGFDVVVIADGQAAISSGCDPTPVVLQLRRRATKVTATWASCLGLAGTVRMRGSIDGSTCGRLSAKVRAKGSRFHVHFTATRSVCGDGFIDGLLGETCEPPGTDSCDATCHTTVSPGSPGGAFPAPPG